MTRRANKRDLNQSTIVDALRKLGFSVLDISRVGGDAPDLVIAKAGFTMLVEVKSGNNKAREGQKDWHDGWQGPIMTANNVDQVLEFYKRWANVD